MALHAQRVLSHSQRYSWKLFLIKFELDINVIFHCGFSEKLTCAFLVYEKQYTHRKNTLSEKRRYLPHFWSDEWFKGTVPNRALSSVHWGRRVTWNYASSKFYPGDIRFFVWLVHVVNMLIYTYWKIVADWSLVDESNVSVGNIRHLLRLRSNISKLLRILLTRGIYINTTPQPSPPDNFI